MANRNKTGILLKTTALTALLLPLGGCFEHNHSMREDLGDAMYANMALMTVNPAPEYNTPIETGGARTALAVERYNTDEVETPAQQRTSEIASGEGGGG